MSLKEMMAKLERMKQEEIAKFKEKYGVDVMTAVEVHRASGVEYKTEYGRIDCFGVDNDGRVFARVTYTDEAGYTILGRKNRFYAEDFEQGAIRKVDEKKFDGCIHYFEFDGYTGRYKKTLTLGGVEEVEIKRYKCKFCGKVRYV